MGAYLARILCGSFSADEWQSPEQEEDPEEADEACVAGGDTASGALSDPGAVMTCRPARIHKRTPRAKGAGEKGAKGDKKEKKSGRSLLFRKSISEATSSLKT